MVTQGVDDPRRLTPAYLGQVPVEDGDPGGDDPRVIILAYLWQALIDRWLPRG